VAAGQLKTPITNNAMYTEEKIDKFIELRARGWSLGHCAPNARVNFRDRSVQLHYYRDKYSLTLALFRREELTDCEAASCSINKEIGQKSSKSCFFDFSGGLQAGRESCC